MFFLKQTVLFFNGKRTNKFLNVNNKKGKQSKKKGAIEKLRKHSSRYTKHQTFMLTRNTNLIYIKFPSKSDVMVWREQPNQSPS